METIQQSIIFVLFINFVDILKLKGGSFETYYTFITYYVHCRNLCKKIWKAYLTQSRSHQKYINLI